MQWIQILSVVFIILMFYVVRIHFKKGELPKVEAIIWSGILLAVGVLVLLEPTADFIRGLFHVTRLTDVIVIFSLMGVFIVMIENRIQINRLRIKLDMIVRDRALEEK